MRSKQTTKIRGGEKLQTEIFVEKLEKVKER